MKIQTQLKKIKKINKKEEEEEEVRLSMDKSKLTQHNLSCLESRLDKKTKPIKNLRRI